MKKILILFLVISSFFLLNPFTTLAAEVRPGYPCSAGDVCCSSTSGACNNDGSFDCQFIQKDATGKDTYLCKESAVGKTFGRVQPPAPIQGLLSKDPSGAAGISSLLSNVVTLFYSVAAIVLIFMLLWGAFDWMTSEGEKEKIHSAQQKIINALIGLLLFAVTFAIIQILGNFTGFKFFVGQR